MNGSGLKQQFDIVADQQDLAAQDGWIIKCIAHDDDPRRV
jgi:hypothetical protein